MTDAISTPRRIQRRRTKGWKMPPGAVYVGRPTRWGNPLPPKVWGLDRSLKVYRDIASGSWNPTRFADCDDLDFAIAYQLCDDWRKRINGHPLEAAWAELRGCDLACWCPLTQPCHADILLQIANGGGA